MARVPRWSWRVRWIKEKITCVETDDGRHVPFDKIKSFQLRWDDKTQNYDMTFRSQGEEDLWRTTLYERQPEYLEGEVTVIKADPGYELLILMDERAGFEFSRVPVIAWRVGGEGGYRRRV